MSLLAALQFLTIVPVPVGLSARARVRAAIWYPLVGALLGGAAWGVDRLARLIVPSAVAAALAIAALALLSGCLHLNGLMDTADGAFGWRTRAQRLAIMRDPHPGAFGVLAAVLLILVKWSALSTAADPARLAALVGGGAAARWAAVGAMRTFGRARTEGLAVTHGRVPSGYVLMATAVAGALAGGLFQGAGGVMLGAAACVGLAVGGYAQRVLGGHHG